MKNNEKGGDGYGRSKGAMYDECNKSRIPAR